MEPQQKPAASSDPTEAEFRLAVERVMASAPDGLSEDQFYDLVTKQLMRDKMVPVKDPSVSGFVGNAVKGAGNMVMDIAEMGNAIGKDPIGAAKAIPVGMWERVKAFGNDIHPRAALDRAKNLDLGGALGNLLPVGEIYRDPTAAAGDIAGAVGLGKGLVGAAGKAFDARLAIHGNNVDRSLANFKPKMNYDPRNKGIIDRYAPNKSVTPPKSEVPPAPGQVGPVAPGTEVDRFMPNRGGAGPGDPPPPPGPGTVDPAAAPQRPKPSPVTGTGTGTKVSFGENRARLGELTDRATSGTLTGDELDEATRVNREVRADPQFGQDPAPAPPQSTDVLGDIFANLTEEEFNAKLGSIKATGEGMLNESFERTQAASPLAPKANPFNPDTSTGQSMRADDASYMEGMKRQFDGMTDAEHQNVAEVMHRQGKVGLDNNEVHQIGQPTKAAIDAAANQAEGGFYRTTDSQWEHKGLMPKQRIEEIWQRLNEKDPQLASELRPEIDIQLSEQSDLIDYANGDAIPMLMDEMLNALDENKTTAGSKFDGGGPGAAANTQDRFGATMAAGDKIQAARQAAGPDLDADMMRHFVQDAYESSGFRPTPWENGGGIGMGMPGDQSITRDPFEIRRPKPGDPRMKATQDFVYGPQVESVKESMRAGTMPDFDIDNSPRLSVAKDGTENIMDGHHRMTAAAEEGKPLRTVVDYQDPAIGFQRQSLANVYPFNKAKDPRSHYFESDEARNAASPTERHQANTLHEETAAIDDSYRWNIDNERGSIPSMLFGMLFREALRPAAKEAVGGTKGIVGKALGAARATGRGVKNVGKAGLAVHFGAEAEEGRPWDR